MAAKKKKSPEPVEDRKAIVDEFGRLHAAIEATKPAQALLKTLKARILGWVSPGHPAHEGSLFDGVEYSAAVTAQENETEITDMSALYDELGRGVFLANCGFTLTRLRELLPAAKLARFTRTDQTGSRSVKPLKRAA